MSPFCDVAIVFDAVISAVAGVPAVAIVLAFASIPGDPGGVLRTVLNNETY